MDSSSSDLLLSLIEVGIALTGFMALISIVDRPKHKYQVWDRRGVHTILRLSVAIALFAALPFIVTQMLADKKLWGDTNSTESVWGICSFCFALYSLYEFAWNLAGLQPQGAEGSLIRPLRSLRTGLRLLPPFTRRLLHESNDYKAVNGILLITIVGISLLCLNIVYNSSWLYLLALLAGVLITFLRLTIMLPQPDDVDDKADQHGKST